MSTRERERARVRYIEITPCIDKAVSYLIRQQSTRLNYQLHRTPLTTRHLHILYLFFYLFIYTCMDLQQESIHLMCLC